MFYSPQLREVHSLLAMKERQKSAKTFSNFLDFNSSQLPCNKHPYFPSSVGICPHCLNDKLMKLACSDCGERRVSSCSCSEISSSSFRNSCSKVDVGSVGRISFLIDNDKVDPKRRSFLRSSSSSNCVDKSNGFWRMKRLFTKRRNKGRDEESEMGSFRHVDDEQYGFWNGYGAREGGFAEILDDENGFGLKKLCVNEMEDAGVCSGVFPEKERDIDERGFIELKLDSWYDLCDKQDLCGGRASDEGVGVGVGYKKINENLDQVNNIASLRRNEISGSCRITMKERGLKERGLKQGKLWKWISKFR